MSLFDGEPIKLQPNKPKVILSASRMTDMPKFYPQEIISETHKRIEKGIDIHTLVLWTKHPASLLMPPLHEFLISLRNTGIQLYVQLTITGLGGIPIGNKSNGTPFIPEPNSPSYIDALKTLPEVIKIVGKPDRIRLRIDPIIRVADANGIVFSSLRFLPTIVAQASKYGVKYFSFSFLESGMHKKVDKRFTDMGCTILPPSEAERKAAVDWLNRISAEYAVNIQACCVSGFSETRCIDGYLLQELHDEKSPTSKTEPRKRPMCGCTSSIDIGGWPPKRCFTGCDYCYANSEYIET